MPELSASQIAIALVALVIAFLAGFAVRSRRSAGEKAALNAGWQHQIDAQQAENDRLAAQTASLKEQINQFQAANRDIRARSTALAEEVQGLLATRNAHDGELAELRSKLELAVRQRDQLHSQASGEASRRAELGAALRSRDEKILRLRQELGRWQERVPPLVERYRERDEEAGQLAEALDAADGRVTELKAQVAALEARIAELEAAPAAPATDDTRIEPIAAGAVGTFRASNERYEDTQSVDLQAGADGHDDLKRIKGIGPAIEKSLNRAGIWRIRQVAELSAGDIARIAAELRGAEARIAREDWIGQAQRLLGDPA